MDENAMCAFDGDKYEELAMLYVKLHATKEHSPSDLFHMYNDALTVIYEKDAEVNGRHYKMI